MKNHLQPRPDLSELINHFDTEAWLEDRSIHFIRGPSARVSAGWLGLQCPFPYCGDRATHMGVAPWKRYTCYRCGSKGDLIQLIKVIDDCGFKEAVKTLALFQDFSIKELKQDIRKRSLEENILPGGLSKDFPSFYLDYLSGRGFDPEYLISKYDLYCGGNVGDWKFRIAIPVCLDGRTVNMTGRDVTGLADKRYYSLPNQESIISLKEIFYNVDNIKGDRAVLVEGPTDVWNMGDGFIGSFGDIVTAQQLFFLRRLAKEKQLGYIHIMFDDEPLAQKKAREVASQISSFCNVGIIDGYGGDPGGMPRNDVDKLRKELGL
jgi:hypothetical protein